MADVNELIQNLQLIKAERDKITPEVIKAGVTIFGVTGTYDGTDNSNDEPIEPEEP